MKWMIASDIHGSAKYARLMLDAYRREGADRLLLLGDLLYHGPRNDLPEEYDPKQVAALLNDAKDELVCVRGNCDADVDQMVLHFPIGADYAVLPVGKNIVYAVHGHQYKETVPPLKRGDILLCGHTHVPACEDHGMYAYLNAGSVSLPKDGSPHTYMTWEKDVFNWKELSTGEVWKTYRYSAKEKAAE